MHDILEQAEKHARESHRMLAAGETHLTGPALHGAFGATKKNIALVLMEAGTDIDAVQRFCPCRVSTILSFYPLSLSRCLL